MPLSRFVSLNFPRLIVTFLLGYVFSPASYALETGRLEIPSFLHQPLPAKVEITTGLPYEIDNLAVTLADQETRDKHNEVKTKPDSNPAANVSSASGITIETELDPYYTNIGLYIPLTDAPMREVEIDSEKIIYRDLLRDALTPRFLLIEASVNPLPVLGTYIREEHESFYDRGEVTDDFNLIEALTEGFEEPYALSFFVGNVIRFTSPRNRIFRAENKGYSGLLVSIGDQHIKDLELFDDNWYEIEWKVKGDRRVGSIYHSWSFRIGSKIHDNPDISDVNYIGIRRELFNRKPGNYDWNDNLGIDYSVYVSRDTGAVVQHQIIFEKHWPRESGVYNLGIGLNETIDKYSGELADEDDETRLILRPGFSF